MKFRLLKNITVLIVASLFPLMSTSSHISVADLAKDISKSAHVTEQDIRKEFIERQIKPHQKSIFNDQYWSMELSDFTPAGKEENKKRLTAFLQTLEKDTADIILVVIGSMGKADQEIPLYIEKFLTHNSAKKVAIFSIDPLYYDSIGFPRSFLNCQYNLKTYEENGISIVGLQGDNIEFSVFSAALPFSAGESKDVFYSDLAQAIRKKLNNNVQVLIGNHTSHKIPLDIHKIQEIFNKQFDDNQEKKFVLYTQCGLDEDYYLFSSKIEGRGLCSDLNRNGNPTKINKNEFYPLNGN